jgi:type VI secretion system protein ImpA
MPAPAGADSPTQGAIEGAFAECPLAELQATASALDSAIGSLDAIEASVSGKVGVASGTNFAKLVGLLRSGHKILSAQMARLGVAGGDASVGAAVEVTSGGSVVAGAGLSLAGDIRSREDVVRLLDKICAYYERAEPSSPVPMLLQRTKRLVSAKFLDIVRDIAPDGLAQAENLGGKVPDKSS